ncbi:putative lipase [Trypanosoma grayi]|uniref:putative lipase n=1 Tax=Trypanosoma grayi TaxID=71804 RepID=UPI0004F463E3|nr:putative lipase [Trypanosoma grayi]KEG08384.1 putative lipase [Trypanosoma grayi]
MWQHLRGLLTANPHLPLLVTGHSLGGAMALLAAADLASQSSSVGAVPRIQLYTFGAPRVGNEEFADWVTAVFCNGGHESYRVTHNRDVVSHVPSMLSGFKHVSHEVWYDNDGNASYRSCKDESGKNCSSKDVSEDPECSNSIILISANDHLLYLGVCTSCSCDEESVGAAEMEEASLLVEKKVYAKSAFRGESDLGGKDRLRRRAEVEHDVVGRYIRHLQAAQKK